MDCEDVCHIGMRCRSSYEMDIVFCALQQLLRFYRDTDGQILENKIMYSKFDLLCIDEFPNVFELYPFLVLQIFNTVS